jgi:hypothetical protein
VGEDRSAGQDRLPAQERIAAEEQELRVLLERAVPQPSVPAQRLESVRARVRRGRRRRAAGLSAAVVAAVAAAGLLVPGLGGPSAGPRPGATVLEPPASGSVAPTGTAARPSATEAQAAWPAHFGQLSGLLLRLPAGWSVLDAPDKVTSYASSQALGLPPDGCAHPLDDFCTPLARTLTPGGALMQLRLWSNPEMAGKLRSFPPQVGPTALVAACRAVGGTEELGTSLVDHSGDAIVVRATVCLAHPTAVQRARIRQVLTQATFG